MVSLHNARTGLLKHNAQSGVEQMCINHYHLGLWRISVFVTTVLKWLALDAVAYCLLFSMGM